MWPVGKMMPRFTTFEAVPHVVPLCYGLLTGPSALTPNTVEPTSTPWSPPPPPRRAHGGFPHNRSLLLGHDEVVGDAARREDDAQAHNLLLTVFSRKIRALPPSPRIQSS